MQKNTQKHWRLQNLWRMLKTWLIQNLWQMRKTWCMEKCWRLQKCWRTGKTMRPPMLVHRKNYAPANVGAAGKVGGPAEELPYCLGSAESATSDFSQAPLMVSFSSLIRVHVDSK
jgi:hypothetical protein